MPDHLTEDQVIGYRTRTLAAEDLLRVSDHIVVCEACCEKVMGRSAATLRIAMARAQLAKISAHISYDELEAHVDQCLDPAESGRIEQHAHDCEDCAADLREMEALVPRTAASAGSAGSFWMQFWRRQSAVAFASICAVVLIFFLWTHNRKSAPISPAIASHPPENSGQSIIHDAQLAIRIIGTAVSGLDAVPQPFRANVERALLAGRIDLPTATSDLIGHTGTLLGTSPAQSATTLLSPVSTVVEDDHPVFHWTSTPDAEYRVTVGNKSFDEVASSMWIRETSWRIPRRLVSDDRYSWQVTVRVHGRETTVPVPPMPDARFRILSPMDKEDLENLRKTFANAHLLMGTVSAQLGLFDAAENELDEARTQHPDSHQISALLRSIRDLRGSQASPAGR